MVMRATAARKRKPANVSRMAAGKRFGRYKSENEKVVRTAEVLESEGLSRLMEAWANYEFVYDTNSPEEPIKSYLRRAYKRACGLASKISYSAEDVEGFSLVLQEFVDENYIKDKSGTFLAGLINTGSDSSYRIHTSHLSAKPTHIGFLLNGKKIEVVGDSGEDPAPYMEAGELVVHGDAYGEMIGVNMSGGSLTVEGNAIGNIYYPESGIIYVKGTFEGRIYSDYDIGVDGVGLRPEKGIESNTAFEASRKREIKGTVHIKGDLRLTNLGALYEFFVHHWYEVPREEGRLIHEGRLIVEK
jgi:hypothetical protein